MSRSVYYEKYTFPSCFAVWSLLVLYGLLRVHRSRFLQGCTSWSNCHSSNPDEGNPDAKGPPRPWLRTSPDLHFGLRVHASRANSFLSGFLIDFISGPVSVGFTSAAAIIIATSQVKDILGLDFTAGKFLLVWQKIFEHIGETRLWDAVLGVVCMIVLLLQ